MEHGDATFGEVFKVMPKLIFFFFFFSFYLNLDGFEGFLCIYNFSFWCLESTAVAPNADKAKGSAASIFEILESKPKIDWSSKDGMTLSTVRGDIVFEHVSFRH